jgi:hypothetical protein
VSHDYAALGQYEFDIPQAQAEDVIQPDCVTDISAGKRCRG